MKQPGLLLWWGDGQGKGLQDQGLQGSKQAKGPSRPVQGLCRSQVHVCPLPAQLLRLLERRVLAGPQPPALPCYHTAALAWGLTVFC